eukprot:365696-Chlamydomonas_euryale.AAC.4
MRGEVTHGRVERSVGTPTATGSVGVAPARTTHGQGPQTHMPRRHGSRNRIPTGVRTAPSAAASTVSDAADAASGTFLSFEEAIGCFQRMLSCAPSHRVLATTSRRATAPARSAVPALALRRSSGSTSSSGSSSGSGSIRAVSGRLVATRHHAATPEAARLCVSDHGLLLEWLGAAPPSMYRRSAI